MKDWIMSLVRTRSSGERMNPVMRWDAIGRRSGDCWKTVGDGNMRDRKRLSMRGWIVVKRASLMQNVRRPAHIIDVSASSLGFRLLLLYLSRVLANLHLENGLCVLSYPIRRPRCLLE